MEHCLEDVVNKLVVVRTPCGIVQGRLVDYELGAALIVEQGDTTKCLVKDWHTIYIIDAVTSLRALYKPPDHSTSHTDTRRFRPVRDNDRLRQKLNETTPPYKKRG